jgi:TolB-like protein
MGSEGRSTLLGPRGNANRDHAMSTSTAICDEATGRLADGVTEDIIIDLSRFRDFDVIARNSTAVYEDSPVDVRQVGKDLNVRYVLECSMQKRGEEIRATAQLVNAATGAHVWSVGIGRLRICSRYRRKSPNR